MNRIIVLLLLSAFATFGDGVKSIGKDPIAGMAQAVVVPNAPLIHTAQFIAQDDKRKLVAPGDVGKQAAKILENIVAALKGVAPHAQVVKLNVYLANESLLPHVEKALKKPFSRRALPAVSFVTTALPDPDALVAMDAVAVDLNPSGPSTNVRRLYSPYLSQSDAAQLAVLPPGGAVYISGQAKTNSTLGSSTAKTLQSLTTTLEFLRLTKADVVQVKCFLQPMREIESVKKEIADFFAPDVTPPCVLVQWTTNNPQPIEIELIARSESTGGDLDFINPPGMASSKVFTRVVRVNRGGRIYCSALYGGEKDKTGAEQVSDIFAQLRDVLKKAGSDFDHMAKATYYCSTADASNQLNVQRPKLLNPERPPAASKAMVTGVGVAGKTVTVDMIAVPGL
jgi:enamine deaminase RidA (YjgF/YER057c/UK114 family)